MVEENPHELDAIFRALADPTRRDMLRRLSLGEHTVGELAEPFDMSLAAASKHIKVLEAAALVRRRIEGRTHYCQLEAQAMRRATEWLNHYEAFWSTRLDALADALAQPDEGDRDER